MKEILDSFIKHMNKQ